MRRHINTGTISVRTHLLLSFHIPSLSVSLSRGDPCCEENEQTNKATNQQLKEKKNNLQTLLEKSAACYAFQNVPSTNIYHKEILFA